MMDFLYFLIMELNRVLDSVWTMLTLSIIITISLSKRKERKSNQKERKEKVPYEKQNFN